MLRLLLPLVLVAIVAGRTAENDRVTFLPGLKAQPNYEQYSGYIQVEDRFYHYWLLMSQNNPSSDPLTLWLNGGPGCSSVIGLLGENGGFYIDQKVPYVIHENKYSWNKNTSMLYLSSPAPVGFSYGGNMTAGDDSVASDNYHFLLGFLDRFPALAKVDFYITGESYAGQYIPQLAHRILTENDRTANKKINLKGFMVGNPSGVSSGEWEYSGYKFMESHGFLSTDEVETVARVCNFSALATNDECAELQESIWQTNLKGVDPYNVLAPCVGNGPGEHPGCFTQEMEMKLATRGEHIQRENGQTFVPCGDYNHTILFMNAPETKAALHISPLAFEWTPCSEHLTYNQYKPGTPDLYRAMVGKIRMIVYSGDIDSCVPFLGTRRGVEQLGLKKTSPYRPWYAYDPLSDSMQIAGYSEDFEGVSFVTVRGAGHMVPWDKPASGIALLNSFIHPHTAPLIRKI